MQDRFDTGIDDLWAALTEPRRLARWIADVEGDLRLGGGSTPSSPARPKPPAGSRCAILRGTCRS